MKMSKLMIGWIVIGWLTAAGGAEAVLIDLGNGMVYDAVQNVTWLQDANYALTSGTDSFGAMDGAMDFAAASAWAGALEFGGETDWRLPQQPELLTLNHWHYDIYSYAPGPFINLQPEWYWTATEGKPGMRRLVHFEGGGVQNAWESYGDGYVLPLRDGPTGVPFTDIKANGQDGIIGVSPGTQVSVTISLYSGTSLWADADYWLFILLPNAAPDDIYSYVLPAWQQGVAPMFANPAPVINFADIELLNTVLPEGEFGFCFCIDLTPDNALTVDATFYYDCVLVNAN